MLKVYDEKMVPLYNEDKRVVHSFALWHKVVTGIVFNKKLRTLYFQTIYPKASYTFKRPDFIDFAVGGHVEGDETVKEAILREAKEELALSGFNPIFLGIRACVADPDSTYHIREFQYFYGIETEYELKNMSFLHSDEEVKSVIEVKIDDFLDILLKHKNEIIANEMILDKATRLGQYAQGITLTADRIIPDYYNDKSIFEKILSVKALME